MRTCDTEFVAYLTVMGITLAGFAGIAAATKLWILTFALTVVALTVLVWAGVLAAEYT